MKVALSVLFSIVLAAAAFAQATKVTDDLTLDAGVAKHAGLDAVYAQFSKGYLDLDPAAVAALYTKDAAYLPPNGEIQIGSAPIHWGFRDFFSAVKKNGQKLSISFRILQRRATDSMAYDVGIFTLKTFKDGKEVGSGQGKFIVVGVRDNGKWKFQVDGYSDLPQPKSAS